MSENEIVDDWAEPQHRATYSPEDNKLRIYPNGVRLDDELGDEYASFKAAGYKWAAKQECFVCPRWTPTAEDWAMRLAGEIDDEDYSYEERAADRAERFEGYREKRTDEAGGHADTFEAGPAVFGHQNRGRAERQARRHDRHRGHALSQWSKAEYWQRRTAGVISHALYKSSAHVRRGRILTIEADQRKHNKSREEYAERFADWQRVATLPGADECVKQSDRYSIAADTSPAAKLAYALANSHYCWGEYKHPRTERVTSLYSLLTDAADPITAREAAALWLDGKTHPEDDDSGPARWATHYELRLAYERAMLAEEGGSVTTADIEPGGWICGHQVLRVHKSPATGRVVSVAIWGPHPWRRNDDGTPKMGPQNLNVERCGEDDYRAPTDEERAAFAEKTKARKAEKKAATPKAPPLINPTDEDAERLQALWNARAKQRHEENGDRFGSDFIPSAVLRMTQAKYSEVSKGAYSKVETRTLHACGKPARRSTNMYTTDGAAYDKTLGAAVCKLRIACAAGSSWSSPRRIVVLTDKPQKPLPLDWATILDETTATPEPPKAILPMRRTEDNSLVIDALAIDQARAAGMLF